MPQPHDNPSPARPSPRPSLLRRAIAFLGGLTILGAWLVWLLLLAAFVMTDRTIFTQYLFWGWPFLLAAALVLGGIGQLMRLAHPSRRRRSRWWVLAFVLLPVIVLANEFHVLSLFRRQPQAPAAATLRLIHWNFTFTEGTTPEAGFGWMSKQRRPDLIFFSGYLQPAHKKYFKDQWSDGQLATSTVQLAIWSRDPVIEIRSYRLTLPESGGMTSQGRRLAPTGMAMEVLNRVFRYAHVGWRDPRRDEPVVLMFARIDTTARLGRPINVYFIDMPSSPLLSRWTIAREAADWIASLQRDPDQPLPPADLVVGDCNTPAGSASLGVLAPGMSHASAAAGLGRLATWPRQKPMLHIDHTFAAPWLRAAEYQLVDPGWSEHRAQVVELINGSRP